MSQEADGTQTLQVKDLKLEDEGEYKCQIGDRATTCKLQVEEGMCDETKVSGDRATTCILQVVEGIGDETKV